MFVTPPPDLTVPSHFHFLHRCKICGKPEKKYLRHRYFYALFRSSRSQMFFKIGVLKNFPNFIETHLLGVPS